MNRFIVTAKHNLRVSDNEGEITWKKGKNYELTIEKDRLTLSSNSSSIALKVSVTKVMEKFKLLDLVPCVAFKSKRHSNLYLSDGIDCIDLKNPHGDVLNLSQALLLIRKDCTEPTEKDINDFKNYMKSVFSMNWSNIVEPIYTPVYVNITQEQLEINRKRNKW